MPCLAGKEEPGRGRDGKGTLIIRDSHPYSASVSVLRNERIQAVGEMMNGRMSVKLLRDMASPIFPAWLYSTAAYLTYILLD
jgi:expansin (peptidoglycan-binding protein)